MGFVAALLDKYKNAGNAASDSGIAEALGVSRQTVSQWRQGTAYPDEEKIATLAIDAHDEPGGWLAAIRAERCTGPAATAYRKIARSFGIAASLLLAVYTANYVRDARASGVQIEHKPHAVCIAHHKARVGHNHPSSP